MSRILETVRDKDPDKAWEKANAAIEVHAAKANDPTTIIGDPRESEHGDTIIDIVEVS